ncbi:hypothetical protein AQUCO_00500499v1 [Aquilegia coerulea]|uniref:Transmembrane protein n=1 Tax=Aquilegia coerulea TaxID=218851 RepID=A0A2G5ES74_AQUCA|nr:hypothetical protein AQUCO_00500499v1 [Aquilegia coerulea]
MIFIFIFRFFVSDGNSFSRSHFLWILVEEDKIWKWRKKNGKVISMLKLCFVLFVWGVLGLGRSCKHLVQKFKLVKRKCVSHEIMVWFLTF